MLERISALTSTTMGGPACHHAGRLNIYINDHGRPSLPPCQKGSQHLHQRPWKAQHTTTLERHMCICVFRAHHFPLEGTSIWSTSSFSLKYSNFTLAISSIESHQDWLRPRITCKLRQDWLHPRTTYRTDYIWETYELRQDFMLRQPVSLDMLELITPSFDRSRSRSHTGALLLLSASYKNAIQSIK